MNGTRSRFESLMTFVSRSLLLAGAAAILCALSISPVMAKDLFYTTAGAGFGLPNGAELFAIQVSGSKITPSDVRDVGPTHGGDCGSLALSSSGILYSMCGTVFGTQYLATIDPKTGVATQVGATVTGLAVMALGFAPNGTLYAVGDCDQDPTTFECGGGGPDPNYNSLYTVDVTTGAFTRVGSTGAPQFFMDLTFDSDGNMLGVTSTINPSYIPAILYRIDPVTGTATKKVTFVGSNFIMGLAFGRNGKLYATDNVPNSGLYLIDPQTGFEQAIAALPLGGIGFSSGLELANPVGNDANTDGDR